MDKAASFDMQTYAQRLGITRLANLTGLDCIGYPVVAAIRPSSRNLSVHFGKGPTIALAKLSAVMEAAELHYSERPPSKLVRNSFLSLPPGSACDPATLEPVLDIGALQAAQLEWVEGQD